MLVHKKGHEVCDNGECCDSFQDVLDSRFEYDYIV